MNQKPRGEKKILIKGRQKLISVEKDEGWGKTYCAHIDMGELIILREAIQDRWKWEYGGRMGGKDRKVGRG